MTIKVAVHHKTHYHYDRLVSLSPHLIRLRPAAHNRTPISAYSLKIQPQKHFLNWQQDPFVCHLKGAAKIQSRLAKLREKGCVLGWLMRFAAPIK